jgi:hypothetical protein
VTASNTRFTYTTWCRETCARWSASVRRGVLHRGFARLAIADRHRRLSVAICHASTRLPATQHTRSRHRGGRLLGFRPEVAFADGIRRTCEYFVERFGGDSAAAASS